MRRRDFVAGLSTLGLIAPSVAQQGSKVYRVAYVSPSTPVDVNKQRATHSSSFKVLFTELKARKYTLGQNLVVDFYSAEGKVERYRPLAREVIATKPDVIHTQSTRLLLVFRDETKTVPIVAFTGDPVEYGIVQTLAKPGGNITGVVSTAGTAVMGKYLELVREVIPNPQKNRVYDL